MIKYKPSEPLDCIEIGSALNMTGLAHAPGVVDITYSFAFGCTNTFAIAITDNPPAHGKADRRVTQGGLDGCTYSTAWAHPLQPDPTPAPPPYTPPAPEPETPADDDGLSFDKVLWAVGAGLVVGAIGIGLAVRSHRKKRDAGSLENLHSKLGTNGDSAADLRASW